MNKFFYFPEEKTPHSSIKKNFQTKILSYNYQEAKNFLCLSEKLFSYTFAKKLSSFLLDALICFMCLDVSLYVKHLYYSIFNIFFYNQLVFVFHPLRDFYIIHNHIAICYFFLLQKDSDTFTSFF